MPSALPILLSLPLLAAAHGDHYARAFHGKDHQAVARSWYDQWKRAQGATKPSATASAATAAATGASGNLTGISNTPIVTTCPDGSLTEVTALLSSYPKVDTIATLVPGDNTAQTAYNNILNTAEYKAALAVAPKGSANATGDFTGVAYDGATDPDCWWSYTNCVDPKQSFLGDDISACNEPDTWGLGFDDGPFCDHDQFYDFLAENKLKASMFYIGSNVANWPARAQRGIVDGHQICVHTWSHKYMTSLTNEEAFAELYYTKKIIKDVLGVTPTCWRPPFGDTDDRIRTIAHGLGLQTIIWKYDTFDWSVFDGATPEQVVQNYDNVYGNASNTGGVIVLTHELNADTIALFEHQYPTIQQKFEHVVPVATCQNNTMPYWETNITYPDFASWVSGNTNPTNSTPYISNSDVDVTPLADGGAIARNSSSSTGSNSPSSGNASTGKASGAQGLKVGGAAVFAGALAFGLAGLL